MAARKPGVAMHGHSRALPVVVMRGHSRALLLLLRRRLLLLLRPEEDSKPGRRGRGTKGKRKRKDYDKEEEEEEEQEQEEKREGRKTRELTEPLEILTHGSGLRLPRRNTSNAMSLALRRWTS